MEEREYEFGLDSFMAVTAGLDGEPIGAGEHLPVDVARLITRLIGTMLGEFDGEATKGRAMQPGEEPFDHTFGHQLEATELRHLVRVEQVKPMSSGHGLGNVPSPDVQSQRADECHLSGTQEQARGWGMAP